MKKFIKTVFANIITAIVYGALIYLLWLKSLGNMDHRAQNVLSFGLGFFCAFYTVLNLLMFLYYGMVSNMLKDYQREKLPYTALASAVADIMQGQWGGMALPQFIRDKQQKRESELKSAVENFYKRGFFRTASMLFFTCGYIALVIVAVMAGYIKTAVYLTLLELFWFAVDTIIKGKAAEIKTELDLSAAEAVDAASAPAGQRVEIRRLA